MEKEPAIYYDASFQIVAPHRGMATYLNGFLDALSQIGENITGLAPRGLSVKKKNRIVLFGFKNILLWEQFSISRFIKRNKVSCFIFPYNTGPFVTNVSCTSVLFVHDLIFMESLSAVPLSSSLKQTVGRFYRRLTSPAMIKKANFIITVSEYSKSKILDRFPLSSPRITVIPNCIDTVDKAAIENAGERGNYFLNIGGDAPHKNTEFLIRGYSALPLEIKKLYSLKIGGVSNSSNKRKLIGLIMQLNEDANIHIEEFVRPEDMEALYKNAFLFIFPSLTEGFGIPLLEAMKYGCTIVCSNTSSMPEVCGKAAFYFNPTNQQSFVGAVVDACTNSNLRIVKKKEAAKQIDYYSRQNFNLKVQDWFNENIKINNKLYLTDI